VIKSLKIAGLCLAAMLMVGMSLAGTANAAELLWLVCLEGSNLTKYTNSTCLTASGAANNTKGWQSQGVLAGQEITVKLLPFSILLIDEKSTLGKVAVKCWDTAGAIGEGVIKSKGEGEIRKAEVITPNTNCTDEEKKCTKINSLQGVHLPWVTNIEKGANGETLTTIKPHAGGEQPGWAIECEVLGIKSTDTCVSVAGKEEKVRLVNHFSATELLVATLFEEANTATCTQGGAGSGKVKGFGAILLPGGALSINTE